MGLDAAGGDLGVQINGAVAVDHISEATAIFSGGFGGKDQLQFCCGQVGGLRPERFDLIRDKLGKGAGSQEVELLE